MTRGPYPGRRQREDEMNHRQHARVGLQHAVNTAEAEPRVAAGVAILGSQTGPQGLQGPKGDTGETGATGPQGPKGDTPTLSRQVVHVQYYPTPYAVGPYYAMCPTGMVATGGGFDVDPTKVTVHSSMPWLDGTGASGWRVYTTNHIGYPTEFGVYALCVSLN